VVVFDANVLISLVSGKTHRDDLARIEGVIAEVSKKKSYVGIPTPALAEFLVRTDSATHALLAALERKSSIRVLPFDKRAASECAILDRKARDAGNKRGTSRGVPYQKVKIDRQIVAIAITNGAEMVVSDDSDLVTFAKAAGLRALSVAELPIPQASLQQPLEFEERSDVTSRVGSPAPPSV